MGSFLDQSRAHRLTVSGDLASFILATGGEQLRVEFGQVTCFGDRHPVITPEVAGLALDPALLVRLRRRAKSLSKRQCERKAMKRVVSSR